MKVKLMITTLSILAIAGTSMAAKGDGDGAGVPKQDKLQVRDQLQTCSPELEKDCTKLNEGLPDEVKECVKDMTKAREDYQKTQDELKKELAACTDEEREVLRQQLKDQLEDTRVQQRTRLRQMRDCLSQDLKDVADQAKDQTQRRGE